ncbi:putative signal recognition particle, SRP19 subunit [Rosa chinensis]|uniref:Putative signal recognition particle, SRP19 subunit n=1 Tax=Rosa chinensis TaxID=74649 RepID=A0A2P6PCH4_ROSCH|nr:putative signal recognition particle, SRP19 subunit [Rosa chinensis]
MDKDLPSIKKWIVLYPFYISSKKTMVEGRRIARENPTCAKIGDCCSHFKVLFAIDFCLYYVPTIFLFMLYAY